jgi:hypothetical protein
MTRVQLKSFAYSGGTKSLSIDNAFIGQLPKRLLFTMVKNAEFIGFLDTNPFNFRHYDLSHFTLFYNGKLIPSDGITYEHGSRENVCPGLQYPI